MIGSNSHWVWWDWNLCQHPNSVLLCTCYSSRAHHFCTIMSFTELGQVCVGLDGVCVDHSCRCFGPNVCSTEWLNDQLECQVWIGSDSEWAVIAFMPCSVSDPIQQLNLNTWQEWDCVSLQAVKSFVCLFVCVGRYFTIWRLVEKTSWGIQQILMRGFKMVSQYIYTNTQPASEALHVLSETCQIYKDLL